MKTHPQLTIATALALALPLLLSPPADARRKAPRHATNFAPGAAVSLQQVIDGDTVWFRLRGGPRGKMGLLKGRLVGINAPECHKRPVRKRSGFRSATCNSDDEFYGKASSNLLSRLLRSGPLKLYCPRKRDGRCKLGGFGRPLVRVEVGGRDVAQEMVRRGAAWTYTKYKNKDRAKLCRLEQRARATKKGMWASSWANIVAHMRPRTRKWYVKHDALCHAATARP